LVEPPKGATRSISPVPNASNPYQRDKLLKSTGKNPDELHAQNKRVLKSAPPAEPAAYDRDRLKLSRQGGVMRTKSFDDSFGLGVKLVREAPRRRPQKGDGGMSGGGGATVASIAATPEMALFQAAMSKVKDKSLEPTISGYIDRIKQAGGFPAQRRLSVRDNDLMADMMRVITNDPKMTELTITGDERFSHIKASYLLEFAEGLRTNLHLKVLKITNVDLGNTFLSALSTSIESNVILEDLVLTDNSFTNEALIEFCNAMESNKTLLRVDLRRQRSSILTTSEDQALESLKKNVYFESVKIDFKSSEAATALSSLVARNKRSKVTNKDLDKMIAELLKGEAERTEQLKEQLQMELQYSEVRDDDWGYLFELSELAQKHRLTHVVMTEEDDIQTSQNETAAPLFPVKFTDDGSFLTEEFISTYLREERDGTLTFAFQTQSKMFKRFPIGDSRRRFISEKFADALLNHPRQKEITAVNMANCACGDEWLVHFCKRCCSDHKLLPKLHMLNMETNFASEDGVIALAEAIANPHTWPYLQVIRLENQRRLISSKAELALAKALCVNRSVIRFSLRVRNMWERNQINKYVSRNLDYTRQARVKHAMDTGTHIERSRNEIEEFF